MIINKKIILIDLLILLASYILYGIGFEFYFVVTYIIANLFRIIYRKFYIYHMWIEWTLLSFRLILLLYFNSRGYLGFHQMLSISYIAIKVLLLVSIFESVFYIWKTYKVRKDYQNKLISNNEQSTLDTLEENFVKDNSKYFDYEEEINFSKKRLDRHKENNVLVEEGKKPEIVEFHGFKVKKLDSEQRKKFLKKNNTSHDFDYFDVDK